MGQGPLPAGGECCGIVTGEDLLDALLQLGGEGIGGQKPMKNAAAIKLREFAIASPLEHRAGKRMRQGEIPCGEQ